jgi:hypothetical protein
MDFTLVAEATRNHVNTPGVASDKTNLSYAIRGFEGQDDVVYTLTFEDRWCLVCITGSLASDTQLATLLRTLGGSCCVQGLVVTNCVYAGSCTLDAIMCLKRDLLTLQIVNTGPDTNMTYDQIGTLVDNMPKLKKLIIVLPSFI